VQLEQALVDRAQLLGTHVAVIDALETARVAKEGQRVNRGKQPRIRQRGLVEIRALFLVEQPTEARKPEQPRAARQGTERGGRATLSA